MMAFFYRLCTLAMQIQTLHSLQVQNMKYSLIVLFSISVSTDVFSQDSLDLKKIRKSVSDTTSGPSYETFIEKFNTSPLSLSVDEGTILYYGKLFKDYKPYKINFDEIEFTKLVSKKKHKQAISKGEDLIKSDPANLELLLALLTCYEEADLASKASLTKSKIELLVSSILAHGSGESKNNTLKVVSVGDEYAIMGILKITGLSRSSLMTSSSVLDTWKAKDRNGKRIDYFVEVVHNSQALSDK
jgi:hypothetical protein